MNKKFVNSKVIIDTEETGQRLKYFRNSRDITISELSAKTGLSKGMISETETGKNKPSPNLMLALLNIYNLDLNWLLTGEGEMFVIDSEEIPSEKKDFGKLNEEIHELLWHLEHTLVVKLAVVGFFLEYMHQNEDIIKKSREEHGNQVEQKQKIGSLNG
ncbi:MAG: helix-turn-helix transcriptional regulator [Candidatus Aminicenantes bacterium]|jgi:transcriptional regulator with XRE-family HTH domain|nr:helix-turn-helix transcriptional regulator [Candidatus Aminicenantes bacterium]